MAYIIPDLDEIRHKKVTDGEKRVAQTLQEKLPQDVLAWFNPTIPPQNLEPDFLVLDPGRGLLVIEIKDWYIDVIAEADDDRVTLLVDGKRKKTTNPLKQCKKYGFAVKKQIEDLSVLLNTSGRYEGNPIFSYGLIIVLTNITRAELKAKGWDKVLGAESVFCKDEIFDDSDSDVFAEKLWSILKFDLKKRLNQNQIDRFVRQLGLKAVKYESKQEDSSANDANEPLSSSQKLEQEAEAKPKQKPKEKPKLRNKKKKLVPDINRTPAVKHPQVEQNLETLKADEYLPEIQQQNNRDVGQEPVIAKKFVASQETNFVKLLNGRYQVEKVLGEGGFAITFIAKDLNRPSHPICVVKKLKNQNSDVTISERVKQLFENEAKVLEELGNHDRIPRLLAHFEEDNHLYIVQEYINGITFAEAMFDHAPMSEAKVTNVILELLEILSFVHGHNVIHRDISPSNIIVRKKDSRLVLIDFGAVKEVVAQKNTSHTLIGTPGYIAPEQHRGKPKFCSDLYSVGIIAIQALTGLDTNEIVADRQNNWSNRDNISDRLAEILLKMISHEEDGRYQSALEAIAELDKISVSTQSKDEDKPKPKTLLWVVGAGIAASFVLVGINFLQPGFTGAKSINESFESALSEEDVCRGDLENLLGNTFCEKYTFKAKSGQQVTIEMNSEQFDPYLILQSPDGRKLKVNGDIAPNNWNSQIVVDLPVDGEYTALAKTSSVGESGKYSLKINLK